MRKAVVFDVGRVLFHWQLRALFEKLIEDEAELDWFLANVVTEEWHFEHDRGRPLADMVPERIAQFPEYERHIRVAETADRDIEGFDNQCGRTVPVQGNVTPTDYRHGRTAGRRRQPNDG